MDCQGIEGPKFQFAPLIEKFSKIKEEYGDNYPIILYEPNIQDEEKKFLQDFLQRNRYINLFMEFKKALKFAESLGISFILIVPDDFEEEHVLRNFGGLANTFGRAMFDFEEEALFSSLFQGLSEDLIKSFKLKAYVFISLINFIIDSPVNENEEEVMMIKDITNMANEFRQEFTVIWCDPNINCESKNKLEKEIEMDIEENNIFHDSSELYQKMKNYTGTPYHLILSGKDHSAEKLIDNIDDLKGLIGLYVYDYSSKKISDGRVEIQSTLEELIPKIKEGFRTRSKLIYTFPSFATNFDAVDKSHLYNVHYYLKGLIHFNNRKQAKGDFVKLARKIYQDQARKLEKFESEYEEYNGKRILYWYTEDSPVFKLVNNCLRISSSDSILYSRFILRDMEQAIKDLYRQHCKDFNGLVYRGAYISAEEWEKLQKNTGQEIEMYGFLSTSVNQRAAANFFKSDPKNKVFITIIIPPLPELDEQGFADVSQFSEFKGESEILFNVRSRFRVLEARITKIDDRGTKGRHLVLLYGSQALRGYMTKYLPVTDLKFKLPSDVRCSMCGFNDKLFGFRKEGGTEIRCIDCLLQNSIPQDTPLVALDLEKGSQVDEVIMKNFKGNLRVFNQGMSFPFYGYQCNNCKEIRKDKYYKWIDQKTGKSFEQCSSCFKDRRKIEGGILIAESNPYVIWQEYQTEWETVDNDHETEVSEIVKYEGEGGVYMKVQRFDLCLELQKKVLTRLTRKSRREMAKIKNFFLLGMACERSGEHQQALKYHQMVLEIFKAFYGEMFPHVAVSYNRLASVTKNLGQYEKALEYNQKALDIRRNIFGDEHSQVAISHTSLASLYRSLGIYQEALEHHKKALSIRTKIYGEKHQDSAISYNGLAAVYESLGQYQEALKNHMKTLDINLAIYGEKHSHIATSYNNLASTHQKLGQPKEALTFQQKTIEIDKIIYGDNHPQTATAYNNLALILKSLGQYQEALEYNKKALEIRQAIYGEKHPDTCMSYNNLTVVYQSLGEYHKALEYFTKALDISKLIFEDKHHFIGALYNNLAEVYRSLKQYPKALEYFQRGLDINIEIYGQKHPQIIISFNNLASVYHNLGKHEESFQYFTKALEISKIVHGEQHPQTALLYNNLALLYKNFGQYETSLEFYEKALEIMKIIYGGDLHPQLTIIYSNIAFVNERLGRFQEAIEPHKKALEINLNFFGDKHQETATSYSNLAFAYESLGQFKEALEHYKKALSLEKLLYKENDPQIAISYNSLALVYEALGQYKEAIEHNNKVLHINRINYGEKHPHIITSYKNLATVYQKMGQHQEALECHNKIQELSKVICGNGHK